MAKPTHNFTPVRAKRTFEVVVELLQGKIFSGEYLPGDRLPSERTLAEQLRVGRPAVREAYRAMELLGILEIRRGNEGGAFIREPCGDSAAEMIGDVFKFQKVDLSSLAEARIAVERAIAELAAARATAEDFSNMEEILGRADERISQGLSATEEGIEFHLAVARASRNPVLLMVLSSITGFMRLWLKKLGPTAATSRREQGEHAGLLACLRQGRTEEAGRLIEEHLRYSKERLEALLVVRTPGNIEVKQPDRPSAVSRVPSPMEGRVPSPPVPLPDPNDG